TATGRLGLNKGFQRSRTFEFTLLTFCPPGPPERENSQRNSASGSAIWSLILSMAAPPPPPCAARRNARPPTSPAPRLASPPLLFRCYCSATRPDNQRDFTALFGFISFPAAPRSVAEASDRALRRRRGVRMVGVLEVPVHARVEVRG